MKFVVEFNPDEGMGMDDPEEVLSLLKEAIRDSGMDSGGMFRVTLDAAAAPATPPDRSNPAWSAVQSRTDRAYEHWDSVKVQRVIDAAHNSTDKVTR